MYPLKSILNRNVQGDKTIYKSIMDIIDPMKKATALQVNVN